MQCKGFFPKVLLLNSDLQNAGKSFLVLKILCTAKLCYCPHESKRNVNKFRYGKTIEIPPKAAELQTISQIQNTFHLTRQENPNVMYFSTWLRPSVRNVFY